MIIGQYYVLFLDQLSEEIKKKRILKKKNSFPSRQCPSTHIYSFSPYRICPLATYSYFEIWKKELSGPWFTSNKKVITHTNAWSSKIIFSWRLKEIGGMFNEVYWVTRRLCRKIKKIYSQKIFSYLFLRAYCPLV